MAKWISNRVATKAALVLWSALTLITPAMADLMIQNVTIIDPVTGETAHQDILIGNGTIAAIGERGSIATFAPVDTLDGTGKYVIPALWDAHVHLTYDKEIGNAALPLFVANGITRVRDTGGLLSEILLVQEVAASRGAQAPEIYFAGPLIDGIPRVYDGTPARFPNISDGASTPEDAERIVDELAAAGASLIKSYEMLKPDVFRALVARATERELPVTSHIPLSMDAEAVIAAGVRGMEHLRNIGLSCSAKSAALLTERQNMLRNGMKEEGSTLRSSIHAAQRPIAFSSQDEARCGQVIAALGEAQVFQTPTLALNTRGAFRQFLEPRQRAPFDYLPAAVRDRWNAFADGAAETPIDPAYVAFADWSLAMVRQLNDAGVPIMAGTDTPIGLLTPGFSLHLEMETLVRAGLTPQEALAAATLRPAQFFGLEGKMGTVEVGKSSELVLLTANPLDDITNTRSINAVITRGVVLDRATLDTMLEEAAP
jgi:imidazolonepropionase-like amidohydrolase